MASSNSPQATSSPELRCIDCGAPVEAPVGGVAICDDCLSVRGSCCPEFGAFDLTEDAGPREYASAPCSAHLHEDGDEATVRHDGVAKRFHTASGAWLDYRLTGDKAMDITHTFVPEHLRGRGLAAALMEAAIAHAGRQRLDLGASCTYAQAYLKRKGLR